ncbi:hypothetical protein HMPREF3212_02834 [Citrobacter freundii]|nr:hypothetical protein AB07_2610 [Citrobacter freundii]KWZ89790.1 hypothetical protein HMPREF3212_02834 [Citrobacter freundii]
MEQLPSQQQSSAFCGAGAGLKEENCGAFLPLVSGVDMASSG